jgi:hypothetical protein
MKTFLVYSGKPAKFITLHSDISALKFVQYGFNWKYGVDLFAIAYATYRKFYLFAIVALILYVLLSYSSGVQAVFLLCLAIIGTSVEFLYLSKVRGQILIGTIEAKNLDEARKAFLRDYILNKNKIFIKG